LDPKWYVKERELSRTTSDLLAVHLQSWSGHLKVITTAPAVSPRLALNNEKQIGPVQLFALSPYHPNALARK
jgi:hypothetical protein